MNNRKKKPTLEIILTIFTIIGSIAAIMVVPEIRQFLGLDLTYLDSSRITSSIDKDNSIIKSIGNKNINGFGSEKLMLQDNQVAIGTADKFEDVINLVNPQFTIFVIYGTINTEMEIYFGGWDLWENPSESFIDEKTTEKIDEVKRNHSTDIENRGYRVIKCFSQLENCETVLSVEGSSESYIECLLSPFIFLGNDWSTVPTFSPSTIGATKTFSHCPPTNTIQYFSIAIDDELLKVDLVCADSNTDITGFFTPFIIEDEELIHWRSTRIDLEEKCRIDFIIKDVKGEKIGIQIKQSAP